MRRKIIPLFLILVCLCFTGCAKVINEYDQTETGVITDKNYRAAYNTIVMTPVRVGKVTTMQPHVISHPAQYNVTCNVNGYIVYWNNKNIYNAYEVDDELQIIIHYREYDDGTIKKSAEEIVK